MRSTVFNGVLASCCRRARRPLTSLLLALSAMAFLFTGPMCVAQDSKTPAVLPAPSSGKAIICIYRVYRFTGSASHDEIYVNGTHLGRLLNSEYVFTEVTPGTVVIVGLPKMYYVGGVVVSSYTAISNATKKENERARFEAEAGKTYYFKWTAGAMETGIKVTPEDPEKGAKEMRKLHLSKPPDEKEEAKQGTEGTAPAESVKQEQPKQEAAKREEPKTEPPKPEPQPQQ